MCTCRPEATDDDEEQLASLEGVVRTHARSGMDVRLSLVARFHRRTLDLWAGTRCTEVCLDRGLHFFKRPRALNETVALAARRALPQHITVISLDAAGREAIEPATTSMASQQTHPRTIRRLLYEISCLRQVLARGGALNLQQQAKLDREGPFRAALAAGAWARRRALLACDRIGDDWVCPNPLCQREGYVLQFGCRLRCFRCGFRRLDRLSPAIAELWHRQVKRRWVWAARIVQRQWRRRVRAARASVLVPHAR